MEEKLNDAEVKALCAILGVKKGTTIDLIYHELQRCRIGSRIRDRQYRFFQKLTGMSQDDAIVKVVIDNFSDSLMLSYYRNLREKNGENEIRERENRIKSSQQSMCKYYVELDLMKNSQIYHSMLSDYYRIILSRWRLSNHSLNIETGRYTKPITLRENRICTLCKVLENEEHVVFNCPRYDDLRISYQFTDEFADIKSFLDPPYTKMKDTANFLYAVEKRRGDLKL